mmetsp:Transcript_19588/g.35556  ORF Transcript_19588/g.35556 Transcript_19588/m.35556 type:complete len:542 (-) Transcript_19588:107-1732(-)
MEDQVFNNDNLSFEVAAYPHSEIETSSKNGNDESVVYDDVSEAPDVIATTTRTKRKKYTLACIASLALLALIIGLSAGLSDRKNRSSAGNRSSEASAANSALTLDECLAEAKADELEESELVESSFGIPTNMPVSLIIEMEESKEEEESRDEEETTAALTYSNDMSQLLGVRRDLRGSSSSSSRNNIIEQRSPRSILKGKESFSHSKSRRLQCEDLIAGAASNKSSNMKKKRKKKQKRKSLVAKIEPLNQTISPVTTSSSFGPISWNSEVNSKIVETGCKSCYSLPSGIATINYNEDGSFLMAFDVAEVPAISRTAAVIVNTKSCDDIVFGEDTGIHTCEPIEEEEVEKQVVYLENVNGFSNNASRIDNGFLADGNEGYAILIVDYDFEACGVLGYASDNEPSDKMLLKATMGVYPNYMPGLTVSGSVTVAYRNDGTFKFSYDLEGVEPACADGSCGIHIHAGTSCDTHAEVLGHGWNSDVVQDLWTEEGGAVYVADDKGNAKGFFNLFNGFSFGKNLGHAVVVHASNGTRIGCGVLEAFV